jgi:hypothetical protein
MKPRRRYSEMSNDDLRSFVAAGGRFVCYEFCISVILATWRRPSDVQALAANELGLGRGIPYSLVSLLLGWWGIPWGLVYTPVTLYTNCRGGWDVTADVLARMSDHPIPG